MKRQFIFLGLLVAGALTAMAVLHAQSGREIRVLFDDGAHLGVQIRDVTKEDVGTLKLPREAGVYVEHVQQGSPAEKADVRQGDVISEYAGIPILSVKQFQRLVSETPVGREIDLSLFRDGQPVAKKVETGRREGFSTPSWAGREPLRIPEARIEIPDFRDFNFRMGPDRRFLFMSDRPRLGITGVNLTGQMAEFLGVSQKEGILVMEVRKDSPAEKAGLKAGDAILAVNGRRVSDMGELSRELKGDSHELEIVRNKQTQRVSVKFEAETPRSTGTVRL